jgi:hypothetical protein
MSRLRYVRWFRRVGGLGGMRQLTRGLSPVVMIAVVIIVAVVVTIMIVVVILAPTPTNVSPHR